MRPTTPDPDKSDPRYSAGCAVLARRQGSTRWAGARSVDRLAAPDISDLRSLKALLSCSRPAHPGKLSELPCRRILVYYEYA